MSWHRIYTATKTAQYANKMSVGKKYRRKVNMWKIQVHERNLMMTTGCNDEDWIHLTSGVLL
jgi:hypothetical protein